MLSFEQPIVLALILPVIAGALYFMLKGGNKKLLISRAIVLSLLIVALASPFTLVSQVTEQENPNLVIISDETNSMQLFEEGVADELYESLATKTPTSLVRLTGDKTALGDAVAQYASSDNQVVLVTDGNNNYGKDLEEGLDFAQNVGSTVYAVTPELESNDLSIQIKGDKTAVKGNEYQFEIIVSQAEEVPVEYTFKAYADDKLIRSGTFTQSSKQRSYQIPYKFNDLGANEIKVELSRQADEAEAINNYFTKSVYVVPKPKVQYITDEPDSPLSNILYNLYDTSTTSNISDLDSKKAVVIDNMPGNRISESDVAALKQYVSNGGGVVVTGGERSYEYGDYLNSSIEDILPVTSTPTQWKGGRDIVLVLDISPSTEKHGTLSEVLGNAIYLVQKEELRGAYMGVIAFGKEGHDVSDGLKYLGNAGNREFLEKEMRQLRPSTTSETLLHEGLEVAQEWLNTETETLDLVIISDGGIEDSYEESLNIAKDLKQDNVNFYFVHIRSSAPSQQDGSGNAYAEKLVENIEGTTNNYFKLDAGQRANIIPDESVEPPLNENESTSSYQLFEFNPSHFITQNSNVKANITGYNDVTPKPGANRLVVASNGKPIVTTWRYGLGRVASITTDSGKAGGWSSQMYSGNNSQLISATVNWAVANPQPEEGAVVEAPDTWFGLPATLTLTMYDEKVPELTYRGDELELAFVGENTYEAQIFPKTVGMHYVSGYPIAVNYAIEYRDVGLNEDLPSLIAGNGGKVYSQKEARANLLTDARQNSLQSRMEPVSWKMYFILVALLLFLGEVMLRRGLEIIESRKKQE
ncbi:vWA domain-containing protein [Methanohalophilus mahii]|uniref:von Willebrand factor type A n=1 Tax=Methanohalophilus mahii (strain ATCC 35705 / DSM 5219 / SLP) TaxID=547558 RepID=D5EBD2_METMS|nr:VWA domain-containing protein [Methanohalophilus mahii]ADE36483.1 von Willebrand factor type A [Methanohalophilus mahii DSM 5219]